VILQVLPSCDIFCTIAPWLCLLTLETPPSIASRTLLKMSAPNELGDPDPVLPRSFGNILGRPFRKISSETHRAPGCLCAGCNLVLSFVWDLVLQRLDILENHNCRRDKPAQDRHSTGLLLELPLEGCQSSFSKLASCSIFQESQCNRRRVRQNKMPTGLPESDERTFALPQDPGHSLSLFLFLVARMIFQAHTLPHGQHIMDAAKYRFLHAYSTWWHRNVDRTKPSDCRLQLGFYIQVMLTLLRSSSVDLLSIDQCRRKS